MYKCKCLHSIEITHSTSTAHIVTGHPGECKNLHGHNYNFRIVVTSDRLDELGMVMDFSSLKKYVKDYLDENFDHKTIIYEKDERAEMLKSLGARIVPYNPTAENMAEKIWKDLNSLFEEEEFFVELVSVEETTNNKALYGGILDYE